MSVVELLQIQSSIIAINDAGYVIWWDLREIKRVQGTFIFKDNISLLPSKGAIRIDPHTLLGIKRYLNLLIMFNQQFIYLATFEQIIQGIKEERIKNIPTINSCTFLDKKELINCLQIINDQHFLIGTNKGNLYVFNFKQNQVVSRISLGNEAKSSSNQIVNFISTTKQISEINSIALYGERQFVLAGLSNGKVYSLRVQTLQKMYELTSGSKQNFESIQKIVASKGEQKFYFLHENYITQWSIKLGSCLSYIEYPHPKDLLAKGNRIIIIGSHSKLIWFDSTQKEYKLSMRSARIIKQLGADHIAVGGSDGMIDILIDGMRLMTLFHH